MRDAVCPHGTDCPYVGDGPYGYPCKDGWRESRIMTPEQDKAEAAAWQRYSERLGWTPVDADYAEKLRAGGEKVRPLYAHPSSRDDVLEEAARIAEEQIDRHHDGVSAVDVRFSIIRGPRWKDGPAIAAAIRAAKGGGHHDD